MPLRARDGQLWQKALYRRTMARECSRSRRRWEHRSTTDEAAKRWARRRGVREDCDPEPTAEAAEVLPKK
jgi:hypothetical protein